MKVLSSIINWVFEEHSYKFFEGSGLALIVCAIALSFCIACIVSKKVRNLFF